MHPAFDRLPVPAGGDEARISPGHAPRGLERNLGDLAGAP
jgi:hypothetical protein